MSESRIHISVIGRIGDQAAAALGGWIEDDGNELVAPYLDQAQLTGLLMQLSNLHIAFDRVAINHATTDQGATR